MPATRRYPLLILLATVMIVSGSGLDTSPGTLAQDAANPALAYLPAAAPLGEGWTVVTAEALELPAEQFRAGAIGVLTGPSGARVLAVAMLVTDARVATRRSWEEASDLYHKYSGELEYDSDRDEVLDRQPLPAGCIEAKRIDGTARQLGLDTGIPMGLTLCAADPDIIVLAVVSGEIGPLTGHDASDAVASLMLGATSTIADATPPAS